MSQAVLSESFGATIPMPAPEPPVALEEVGSIGMLLKSPKSYARMVAEDRVDLQPSLMLGVTSMGLYALYGVAMGFFAGGNSLWQAPLKAPLVLLGTLALSGPCLYLLLCAKGIAVSGRQVVAMLAGVAGLSSVVMVSLAPVVWLFGISIHSVPFMVLLHATVWCIALGCGWRLLLASLPGEWREHKSIIVWACLSLVLCAQMTTFYRPMLGVTVTKEFRERQRAFFFEHFYSSMAGHRADGLVPQTMSPEPPPIPIDPSRIGPPPVAPMSN